MRLALVSISVAIPILLVSAWAHLHNFESSSYRVVLPWRLFVLVPAVTVCSVLVGLGPIVGRIRQLTEDVRTSARAGYRTPVTVDGADEVGELARAFELAGNQIRAQLVQQAERERTLRNFLENTTHDVMIPLTVLQGHLAAFQRRLALGERLETSAIGLAMNEAHYMGCLFHNLGLAAKLEAGEPELQHEAVDLTALVRRASARHVPIARQQGVSIDAAAPEAPLWCRGDMTLIEQAVSNLVYNAVRYNRRGGHVAIVLEGIGREAFSLTIVDDGPGIAEAELSNLIERYFRGNEARSRGPGHGLGLNIAFRVAKLHGWQLRLSKSDDAGLRAELEGSLL
jgi:signal transduction histidine kinase